MRVSRFARALTPRLRRAARHFPVVVLTGARQTGKTTLLRATFPKHAYVTLDVPSEAAAAERDPESFLARHPPPLLVDEVQYAPGLFRHVKRVVDARPRRNGSVILTGSQKLTLMKGVSESLAGRAAVLELEALSAAEVRTQPRAASRLADTPSVLVRGLMPALWADPRMPHDEFFASYVATYLERDLRQIVDVRDLRDFERFLRLAAVRSGQLLNQVDLARDVGVAPKTLASWLAALEATNQIVLLPPYFANIGKRLVKTPKLYFTDTGLLSFLLGIEARMLAASPLVGPVFETAVFAEIRKTLAARGATGRVYFYRDHDGGEVDFVVASGPSLDLVECKWTEHPPDGAAAGLARVAGALGRDPSCAVRSRLVACRTPAPYPLGDGARAVHGFGLAQALR